MLEIRLIGTVEAVVAGEVVALPGRRARSLLALLALSAGETVSTESLATGIWDDDPPENVRGSLQTYVGRLRRLLGDGAIETRPTGYALLVPRTAVDLHAHWDSARSVSADGDPTSERAALAGILDVWRAEPFGETPSEWLARHERPTWVERRLQILERWVDLSFDAGDHQGCLDELSRQVEAHPLREPLWARFLTGLDAVGRTADALDRYETVRKRLAEELGVDPSPQLRSVYLGLLARADEHAVQPIVSVPVPVPVTVPRQLPTPVRGFVGRTEQLSEMDRVLAQADAEHTGGLFALHGPGGSGKTTLALHWAHRVKDRFPDGQLFLDLRGYGPGEPMEADRSLSALLRGLGVPAESIPDDSEERSAMLRSESEGRRLLIVLDNARESEQVRPLLPGSDSVVLVTSRTQLRGLVAREAAHRVGVDQMSSAEAVALLRRRLGDETAEGDILELAELCGHLPVALAVAAERVGRTGRDTSAVGAVISELRDHKRRLDTLSSDDDDPLTSVRAVLEWSYRSLDDHSARVLRHLGLYAAPLISAGAVAALVGADRTAVARAIDRLTDRHLLKPNGDGHFLIHDLVRDYAAEVVAAEEAGDARAAATRRLRSWFVHSAAQAARVWSPRAVPRRLPELETGVVVDDYDSETAVAWFEAFGPHLRRLVADCADDGDPAGHLLVPILFAYLRGEGSARDIVRTCELAEESARRLGDLEGQAACANYVAGCYYERGEFDAAIVAVTRSRDLSRSAGDVDGELRAQGNLAVLVKEVGQPEEAAAAFEQAISDARRIGTVHQLGWSLFNASDFYRQTGRLDDALRTGEEAVEVLGRAEEPDTLANAIENLAEIQAATGSRTRAVETMRSAIDSFRALRLRKDEVGALYKLGLVHRDLGEPTAARDCWENADRILRDLGVAVLDATGRDELAALIAGLDGDAGPRRAGRAEGGS